MTPFELARRQHTTCSLLACMTNLKVSMSVYWKDGSQPGGLTPTRIISEPSSNDAIRIGAQTACDLQLWQEAFRSVEDIQGLMTLSAKPPKAQLMAVYYARLTRIFAVSGAHLYNGYAWYVAVYLAGTKMEVSRDYTATRLLQPICTFHLAQLQ